MERQWNAATARLAACTAALLIGPGSLSAQDPASTAAATDGWAADPPVLSALVDHARNESELRVVWDRYRLDLAALQRRYPIDYSPARQARLERFYGGWGERFNELDFDALTQEGKIDYILLSPALFNKVTAGGVFRKGVWGGKNGTLFPHYDTMTKPVHQASDHAAVFADIAI